MTHTDFTGLLSRKKVVRYLIYLLFVCVFAVFVFKLNQVEKQNWSSGQVRHLKKEKLQKSFRIILIPTVPVSVSRKYV